MNKKLGLAMVSVSTFAIAVVAATSIGKTVKVLGNIDETWNHYAAKAATVDTKGCKEYWVNCTTHEHRFTAPESGVVKEGNPVTQGFIDTLPETDDRLVERTNVISFENASDADLISSVRSNINTKEVIDGGTNGTKCLKLTYKDGTYDFMVAKAYLDAAFADPSVEAVNFDIKGDTNNNYLAYNKSGTGVGYDPVHNDDDNITTEWKTCSWLREYYDAYIANPSARHAMLWATACGTLYLDNIRPVTKANDFYSAERGKIVAKSAGADYLKKLSLRDTNNKEAFILATNATETDYGFSYEQASAGLRSFKMHKYSNNYVQIASPVAYAAMGADDLFAVDVYFTTALNFGATVRSGNGTLLDRYGYQTANEWHTYYIAKSECATWGCFMDFGGSPEYDIYVDNARIVKANVNLNGFEDSMGIHKNGTSFFAGENGYNKYSLKVSGATDVKLSKANASEGKTSLMIDKTAATSGEIAIYFNPSIKTTIGSTGNVKVDVYTTFNVGSRSDAKCFVDGNRNILREDGYNHLAGRWVTYTLTADDFTTDGRGLILATSVTGQMFIDNIVVTPAA